jgi:2-oxoisovalerate dehydrogenase E1 component
VRKNALRKLPALDLLKVMLLSREGDLREGLLLRQNRGWFQVAAMGHEALAALIYHLEPEDYLYPYYRDRALALARGMTNRDMASAYFAKRDSNSGGRMMPSHYSSRRHNIFSCATPTGSQCLPAAGTAWAFKLRGSRHVALCTIGDAATRQGEFYEALAFALQEKAPVVFVVEDNGYGISTPTARFNPYALGALGPEHVLRVNGRDPFEVFARGGEAIAKAREGAGPTVLWCELDRISSHTSGDDQRVYRPLDEIKDAADRDPLFALANQLIAEGALPETAWRELKESVHAEVDRDYTEAESAPDPSGDTVSDNVYGPVVPAVPPPDLTGQTMTMVAAINHTLRAALAENDRVVLFGEDIEDPKGGVFGLTKGLSTAHPGRVFNSPLAEATIAGVAVGMAVTGYKPVFELQFIDFAPAALNQLITQVSTLRWRTQGEWNCPMVLMAPYGAYLPAGAVWHSESKEALFAHIPGIRIVIPSTPGDAAALLWTAIHCEDPVLFLIPKHLFRQRIPITGALEAAPFGEAVIRRDGEDVTVLAWGNCVELAELASEQLSKEGVSAEVIDLRTLVPCDWEAIENSLAKTGRLVVVQEDNRTCGFGQTLIAESVSHSKRWDLFLAPPRLVARTDTPIPYHPDLEHAALPDVSRVVAAIRATLE